MNTENTNNHGPEIITMETATPWSIVRDLTLSDGSTIEAVTITATRVDYFGQECEVAEWHADLTRFNSLTADLVDEADHEARWDAEQAAVDAALDDLRRLDRNGAATLTDGTLDGYTAAEKLEIIREAIATIKADNA